MPLPDDFAAECLYRSDAWFAHDLVRLEDDPAEVEVEVDTTRLGPLVDAQVEVPGHPRHVPGAVCIQLTGTLGSLLATYVLGMRRSEGWVGYGTHIHDAKFSGMGRIGPPVRARATVLGTRTVRGTTFVRYRFLFTQGEREIYRSEQSAAWFRPDATEDA